MMLKVRSSERCRRRMFANGPAIWGGCVTRREHRYKVVPVGYKVVQVQGGYGACFCSQGTSFIEAGRVSVQV
jgi:hypothetical protein